MLKRIVCKLQHVSSFLIFFPYPGILYSSFIKLSHYCHHKLIFLDNFSSISIFLPSQSQLPTIVIPPTQFSYCFIHIVGNDIQYRKHITQMNISSQPTYPLIISFLFLLLSTTLHHCQNQFSNLPFPHIIRMSLHHHD